MTTSNCKQWFSFGLTFHYKNKDSFFVSTHDDCVLRLSGEYFFTLFSVCWAEKDLVTISSCKHLQGLQEEPPKGNFFVRDLWVYHHRWLMSGKVPYPSDHLLQMMLLYSLLLLGFISESYINPCHTNLNLCVLFVKRGYKETETSTEFTRIV